MTLVIETYTRKPFEVEAVRVSEDNIHSVAEWCEGTVVPSTTEQKDSYISLHVHRPLNARQTKAYPGDWVLKSITGFRVYPDETFHNSFDLKLVYTEEDAEDQLRDYPDVDGSTDVAFVAPEEAQQS